MSDLLAARSQMAVSLAFHIIFAIIGIAMPVLMVIAERRWQRTRDPGLLAKLPMPVLFVTGDEDWVFPPAAGPALAKLAAKGSAVRVPAAGHSVYFERAAKFNEIIRRVL